jgi:hypothetical protein
MAKSAKKASKKTAKKSGKKVAKKAAKKVAKKAAKKAARKAPRREARPTGKRFLIIYHAPLEAMLQTANASPEENAEGMAMWRAWAERVGEKLADLGAPLMNGKRLTSRGLTTPSTRDVSGYSLIRAEDWEEVMSLLEGHPHLSGWHPEATIEVHEPMDLPGM